MLAHTVPCFGDQGRLEKGAAELLGIAPGVPVCYRAGDQPNNAFSLNVLEPGEIAATAGTSAVVYGVTDNVPAYDAKSRVNSFIHVNHRPESPRYGILMCLNGTGILNSWLKKQFFASASYSEMNAGAQYELNQARMEFFVIHSAMVPNASWRIKIQARYIQGLDFNRHDKNQLARAAQEGIVFSMIYGTEIMQAMGVHLTRVRAGHTNMFLSDLFAPIFANLSGCTVELYNTDGALGAARGAGFGANHYR